jgi:TonB family protein
VVTPPQLLRRVGAAALLARALASPLAAQHVLIADDEGKYAVVCSAVGTTPFVDHDGKLVSLSTYRFALQEVPEYMPVFVNVRNVHTHTSYITTSQGSGEFNNEFHFTADFESGYRLKDVFVVLAVDSTRRGKTVFLWGVGELKPGDVNHVSIVVPMDATIGEWRYTLHLFCGGAEVLQTQIPSAAREAALDRMVALRIKGVHESAPKLLMGLPPDYPPEMKKANVKGQAVISVRIGANGAVFDPAVKSATDPAFGTAALAAVKFWRFLPKVRNDYPVEARADVPLIFTPPASPNGA